MLHRDVKPSNVLMEGRTPILIDFGLARVADDPKLTHTGWLLGTPGYLAPEILHGDDATVASDVHSWAATVAFAGTGRPPFGRGPSMAIMDRVRRGEHDLDGLPDDLRRVVAAALDPDPHRRPSLPEVIHRLRSGALPAAPPRPLTPVDDDVFTAPLAVAALAHADDLTSAGPTWADDQPVRTLVEPDHQDPWNQHPWPPQPALPPRPSLAVRARTTLLLLAAALAGGAAIAAYPYLATFALVVAAWLLRSGSLAASAASNRRLLRGRPRWYDGPQLLVAAPWHLVQSIPGTLMLTLWGLGLATAAALFCYAFGLGLTWTLFACGVAFLVGLWLGPGGSRVRGPVQRVVGPVTARPAVWLVTLVVLLSRGRRWRRTPSTPTAPTGRRRTTTCSPASRRRTCCPRPFADPSQPGELLGHGRQLPVRVQPARVRQHPQPGAADGEVLRSDGGGADPEGDPVGGHADHRQPAGADRAHEGPEPLAPGHQFLVGELVGPRGRPRHDVGDPEAEGAQRVLLLGEQQPRGEAAPGERRPEPVARAREVVPGRRRHQPGVDAAEEHPERRVAGAGEHVGNGRGTRRLELLPGPSRHTRHAIRIPRRGPRHPRSWHTRGMQQELIIE